METLYRQKIVHQNVTQPRLIVVIQCVITMRLLKSLETVILQMEFIAEP
jgi:hypothetical protein